MARHLGFDTAAAAMASLGAIGKKHTSSLRCRVLSMMLAAGMVSGRQHTPGVCVVCTWCCAMWPAFPSLRRGSAPSLAGRRVRLRAKTTCPAAPAATAAASCVVEPTGALLYRGYRQRKVAPTKAGVAADQPAPATGSSQRRKRRRDEAARSAKRRAEGRKKDARDHATRMQQRRSQGQLCDSSGVAKDTYVTYATTTFACSRDAAKDSYVMYATTAFACSSAVARVDLWTLAIQLWQQLE